MRDLYEENKKVHLQNHSRQIIQGDCHFCFMVITNENQRLRGALEKIQTEALKERIDETDFEFWILEVCKEALKTEGKYEK